MNLRSFLALFHLALLGFTDGSVKTVSLAWKLAEERGQRLITTEHLLGGLVSTRRGLAAMDRVGLPLHDRPDEVLALIEPAESGGPRRCEGFTDEVRVLLAAAYAAANYRRVSNEHIVLALLSGPENPAADYLRDHGLRADFVRQVISGERA